MLGDAGEADKGGDTTTADAGKEGAAPGKDETSAASKTDDKASDAAADSTADVDDDGDTSLLDDDDGEGNKEPAAKADDKGDGKDGKPAEKAADKAADKDKKPASPDWGTTRAAAIDREMKRIEAQLAKKVTAAELPKELEKRRGALEKQLGRYASVEDALIAGYNAQQKIASGAYKAPLPDDASDAEKAEWRTQNGIPAEAKDYEIAKVDGHTWTDDDKPLTEALKGIAHQANLTQAQLNAITKFYATSLAEAQERQAEEIDQIDKADVAAGRDKLREELGPEYRPTMKLVADYLKDTEVFPDGIGDAIAAARTPDGHRLINNHAFMRWLGEQARGYYGEGALISGEQATAIKSEKEEIEALMNTDIDAYQRKPWKSTGKTASERYAEILRKEADKGRRAA